MAALFSKWFSCASCRRRAVDTAFAVKEAVKPSPAECPISGESGTCPYSQAGPNRKAKNPTWEKQELTRAQKLLRRASELISKEQYDYAIKSFETVLLDDDTDWRGHYGKVICLQCQGKTFLAFSACRRGREKAPQNELLIELEQIVRHDYKQERADVQANKPKMKEFDLKARTESAAPVPQAPSCPGELAAATPAPPPVSRVFEGRVPDKQERASRKNMILSVFRDQWARIGKAKDLMAYADYSKDQQVGLQIKGGHQPLPRPKNIELPEDYKKSVGVITSEQLGESFSSDSQRLVISLYGDLFDVSDRPDKYGKDGPYHYFAGRDITWGLVTGEDSEEKVNLFYDLFKMEEEELSKKLQCICSWIGFYEVEYGDPIGRLQEYEAEEDLPAPPLHEDEQCSIQ